MDSSLWLLHLCHLEGFHPQRLSFQVNVCLQKTGRPTVSRVVCSPKAYRRAEGGAQCGAVSGLRLAIRLLRAGEALLVLQDHGALRFSCLPALCWLRVDQIPG